MADAVSIPSTSFHAGAIVDVHDAQHILMAG